MPEQNTPPAPSSATLAMAHGDIYRRANSTGVAADLTKAGAVLLAEAYTALADAVAERDRLAAELDAQRLALSCALNIDETECDGPPSFEDLLAEVGRVLSGAGS